MPPVEKEKLPLTIQEMAEQRYTLEERLKLLTEDDWYRGIYLEDYEFHFNPVLADCFANWLKENGESTEIPDRINGESTNVTVEEIAALLRKAPTPMLPDVYVKTINHEVEDVVLAKFYEIVPEDLFQNYFKFFLDWMNPSIPRLRNGKNFEPWRAILDEETKFDIYTD